jgi:MmyB-like transcription regulator ligand binding domain
VGRRCTARRSADLSAKLIDELSTASRRFRELWARADVGYRTGTTHMRHPRVGEIHLRGNLLSVPRRGGHRLLMYSVEPGSQYARALEELRSLSVLEHDDLVHVQRSASTRSSDRNPKSRGHQSRCRPTVSYKMYLAGEQGC